jgi:hypothetical protein
MGMQIRPFIAEEQWTSRTSVYWSIRQIERAIGVSLMKKEALLVYSK